MKEKPDVLQATLALLVLKTLDVLGPQHGYGTPNPPLRSVMPPGSMRPSLRKAAHGAVEGKHVRGIRVIARRIEQTETRDWEQTAAISARFFAVKAEDLS